MAAAEVASVAIPILGALIAEAATIGDYREVERLERLQAAALKGEQLPELQQLVAEQQGRTELDSVQTDPRLRTAQMRALELLQQQSEEGLNFGDRLSLEDSLGDAAAYEAGQRGALQQSMASRGMAGSGLEAMQAAAQQQAGANRASRAGLDVAARAQQRALQALMESGELAGRVRQQDYGEASAKAQAQDEINRFNAQMKQQTNFGNADEVQRDWDRRYGRAQDISNLYGEQADRQEERADRKKRTIGGVAQAGGYGAGAYAQKGK